MVSQISDRSSEPWLVVMLCAAAAALLALVQPGRTELPQPVSVSAVDGRRIGATAAAWWMADPQEGPLWVEGRYDLPQQLPSAPLAFSMSGLFSAELYWNGELIGRKGRPAADAEREIAGSIDRSIPIPERLLSRTDNRWALKISSNHKGYRAPSAVQRLEIGPYRGPTRQLTYYLPALLVSGGILACLFVALGRATSSERPRAVWLAASSGFLLAALGSEISRSVLNYSYDWHVVRQVTTLAMLGAHCACLLAAELTGVDRSARRKLKLLIGTAATLAFAGILLGSGFDRKMEFVLGASYLALVGSAVLNSGAHRVPNPVMAVAAAAALLLILRQANFLDAGVYAFGVAFIAGGLVRGPARAAEAAPVKQERPRLLLSFRGMERLVDWDAVYCIRASGNDCEILLRGGHSLCDSRGLGKLLESAPPTFLRVHKSFAVNLCRVRAIERLNRGSHVVVLEDGSKAPLSRGIRHIVCSRLREGSEPVAVPQQASAPSP